MPQVRYTPEGYPYYTPDASGDVTAPGEVKTGWPFAEYRPEQPANVSLSDLARRAINAVPIEGSREEYDPLAALGGYLAKSGTGIRPIDLLLGLGGNERFKLWPERMVESAVTLPKQVYTGEVPVVNPVTGRTAEPVIERAQDVAGVAMGGSMPFAQKAALGTGGGRAVVDAALQRPQGLSALKANPPKAPTFYSAVENAVMNSKQAAAPADQWLATLRNHPGVKQEELNWLGVEDFLNANKGQPVTKADLQDYINAHRVEVRDVIKGEPQKIEWRQESPDKWTAKNFSIERKSNGQYALQQGNGKIEYIYDDLPQAQQAARQRMELPGASKENVQYADYQLPGGTNYNELLLSLPEKKGDVRGGWTDQNGNPHTKDTYQSPHWDEPNVLAHVRFNDRMIDGKKTLFLEEVQSDWHQTGRKSGYKQELPKGWTIEEVKNGPEMFGSRDYLELRNAKGEQASVMPITPEGRQSLIDNANAREGRPTVPDAPFKKSWPELALKRMVRYAAENGYDAIAWTPGEVQTKRWSGTGESGHKKFYDEILVNAANKLAKGFGGKVKLESFADAMPDFNHNVNKHFGRSSNGEVHFLELPQGMRDAATQKGFPLFMGGHMLVPIDGEPELDETPSQKMKRFIEKQRRSGGRADPNGPPALSATIVPPPGYRNLMTDATP